MGAPTEASTARVDHETIADYSQLQQICEDKLHPFIDSGEPPRGPRRSMFGWREPNDAFRALWGGFIYSETGEAEMGHRGARIAPDHGVYPTKTGVKKGVWSIRFYTDPTTSVEEALVRALAGNGNVIEEYNDRNQANDVTIYDDGSASLCEYRRVEEGRGIPTHDGREFLRFGSSLSQELSDRLAEEIASFTEVTR